LTTHYLEEAESLCRHVAIIDDGRIIENGRMEVVLRKLQQEVFVLSTRDSIEEAPDLPGFQSSRRSAYELEVQVNRGHDLNELFSALSCAGIHVVSMRNRSNRLEELFLSLTDKKEVAETGSAPESWRLSS